MLRRKFIKTIGVAGAGLLTSCANLGSDAAQEPWRKILTDHFDGHHFFNPNGPTGNTFANFIKWRRTRTPGEWPDCVDNKVKAKVPERVMDGEILVTFINHCTFLIQASGANVLTDPVYSERVSPVSFVGPRRVRAPGLAWEQLPPIDAVLISHAHYDHMDMPTLIALEERWQPLFITGLGNRRSMLRRGLKRVVELDWWQSPGHLDFPVTITFVPAQHWSARGIFDRNTTLWGGFYLTMAQGKIYFCGDAGYGEEFKLIRDRLGNPDLAILPIGAYKPRWFMASSHMSPDEAVQAHLDLGAQHSMAMHFDTFPLADEAFGVAEEDLRQTLDRLGLPPSTFQVPVNGATYNLRAALT